MKKIAFCLCLLSAFILNNSFAQQCNKLFTSKIGAQAYTYRNSLPNVVSAAMLGHSALFY
jgi:hypothetical protein